MSDSDFAIDWDDPTARLALIERVGPQEYNRLREQHLAQSIVATVNGHAIRPVATRFGRLFSVGTTRQAFSTLDAATRFARG